MDLSTFNIDEHDQETFHHIFEGDDNLEFKNRNFCPKARIINLLLQHIITPRSEISITRLQKFVKLFLLFLVIMKLIGRK